MMEIISSMLDRKDGKRQKDFTVIELFVVVIGILAIAVLIFLNQRKATWNASVESDVKNAATVVETMTTSNNGSLPSDIAGATSDDPISL